MASVNSNQNQGLTPEQAKPKSETSKKSSSARSPGSDAKQPKGKSELGEQAQQNKVLQIDSSKEQEAPRAFKDEALDEDTLHDFATQKRLLASCERVNLLNLQVLGMDGYPDNWSIDSARKIRDLLVMGGSVALGIFIIGLGGLFPAAASGIALGISVLLFFLAFSPIQSAFTNKPSLTELVSRRTRIVNAAKGHVQFLEGESGLAWRCEALGKYNRHLYNSQFSALLQYSKAGRLSQILSSPRHFRLYLIFMVEAQKGYRKLQTIYLSEGFSLPDT